MIFSKMLRVADIFSKLDIDEGGYKTALASLDSSIKRELSRLAIELTEKGEKVQSLDTLIKDYNSEYKRFIDLINKHYPQKEEKEETIKEKITTHDIFIKYAFRYLEINGSLSDVSLCDAFLITHESNKKIIWKGLEDISNSHKKEASRMTIKQYLKRSNIDNWEENKKWLQYYA